GAVAGGPEQNAVWQGGLAQRMQTHRARKRKAPRHLGQSQFSFETAQEARGGQSTAVACRGEAAQDDFTFTLAIGPKESLERNDGRMEIDVSVPPKTQLSESHTTFNVGLAERYGSYPVASLEERRLAALIDLICLLFAYGGFLALFGSLGGHFTISKLSAAVYAATIAIVYVQYFALFTIFGGTTPGMMFRGLQVTSFDGDPPRARQL